MRLEGVTYCANHERNWAVQIVFPGKPDAAMRQRLSKDLGLTWAPSEGAWIRRGSWVPYNVQKFLEEIGAEKVPDIERVSSFAERLEAKAEKAEARAERLEERAEAKRAEANRLTGSARSMAEAIPFGQPILVGHHSEKRDRNYRARIENKFRKGYETGQHAQDLAGRAATAAATAAHIEAPRPDFCARRIREAEAEIRRLDRIIDGYKAKGYQESELQRLMDARQEQEEKRVYYQTKLDEQGGVRYGPDNIKKGAIILAGVGLGFVRRVNPTSVTVDYLNPAIWTLNPAKCDYGHIKDVKEASEIIAMLEAKLAAEPNQTVSGMLANLRKLAAV